MSNIVPFRQAEFVNIHGRPVGVSMKQLVLRGDHKAWCEHRTIVDKSIGEPRDWYTIKTPDYEGEPEQFQGFLGSGATEEAAWRSAYFNIMAAK